MNVKIEKVEKNVVQLEIEVDAAKFEAGMQKAFLRNAKKYNIPGFRKGKAPRKIIERYYGEQVFYEDAINAICPEAYDEAVEKNDIQPVDRPEIDIKSIGEGQDFIFTAKVTVKPEVELGEYKNIEVKKAEPVVSDMDIERELKEVAEKNSRLISVEDRGIKSGDTAIIDFEGFVDGVAFEGGKASNYSLEIGSGEFVPGFEDQLIDAKTGDEVEIKVSFPEDYGNKELAGKPAVFKVKVNEIKMKEMPELDDEFAKDVSEFDTLDEYKEDLKKKLSEKAEQTAKLQTEENVIDEVIFNAKVDVPQIMIEKHIDDLVREFDSRLHYQGYDLGRYLAAMNMDIEALRAQFKNKADKEIKTQLILEKVAQVENITATEEEAEKDVMRMAENYKQSPEDFKKHLSKDDIEYIKRNLVVTKTIDFLVENAKLV